MAIQSLSDVVRADQSAFAGLVHTGDTAPANPVETPIWITLAGRLRFWDGTDWFEPPGRPGADGREVELRTTATHIQWRYVGAATWTDLLELSTLSSGGSSFGQLRKASFLL